MKTTDKPLHVLSLEVENIMRVSAVYIEPTGKLIEITGKNFQGKSSTLDALWMAFGGAEAIPAVPVRKGAASGHIIVQIGDDAGPSIKVTRKIIAKDDGKYTTSLIVENADGQRFQKPQDILNALTGQYMADPLDFLRSAPKVQFDALKGLVPGFDFAATDSAIASHFSKRTDVNRTAKEKRAQAAGIVVPQQIPTERIDETALVDEMQSAGEHNAAIERERARRAGIDGEAAGIEEGARRLLAEAEELRTRIDALVKKAESESARAGSLYASLDLPDIQEPIDVSAVKAKIEQARLANAMFDKLARRQDIIADAEISEAEAADLTMAIARGEADKKAAIAAANIPVKGITFGDGAILLGGFPLDQASGAQQLRCAVEVAAALNPRLRFVRVKDASLLDADSWKELGALCEELNLQVFAETVASGRAGAVVIEDGMVAGAVKHMEAAE